MRILARAQALEAQGRDVVHMEVGEPDFPTPEPVVRAAQAALAAGLTRYTPAAGLPALREAIAAYYPQRFGVDVSPTRILITPGSSLALQLALAALVDPGDEVLLCDPGYPCNRHLVRLAGGGVVPLPVGPETGFRPTPAQVEAAWTARARALLVASPANPTGTVIGPAAMAALRDAVAARGGMLVVDELYQGLDYDAAPHTALALGSEDVIVVNGFSKYFGMTGWRLGWIIAPEPFAPVLDRLAQNLYLAAPTVAQHAALAALTPETLAILDARRDELRVRRDRLRAGLERLGFVIAAPPEGAFYLYADSSAVAADSFAFAERLLEEAGVAVTPGADFGANRPEKFVRFAYTTEVERLEEGLRRIGEYLRR
ncbi:MAG: pyridoxal phosphate-dependent aminotransferase [Burkholderiales bacterium]|jgi:aspartate/methionine/tyrosine aminotransferase|nr:pyridoxal phosphate-dependent aminotransferase [Burkholderiales bacterium]